VRTANIVGARFGRSLGSTPKEMSRGGTVSFWTSKTVKQAENALKETKTALAASEENLSLIINSLPVLVWSARPDGSAAFVNKSWLDYAGLPEDQILEWAFWTFIILTISRAWWYLEAGPRAFRPHHFEGTYPRTGRQLSLVLFCWP